VALKSGHGDSEGAGAAVAWAESAVASLVDAIEYIARDSPSYAAAFAARAETAAASLATFPERGRRVRELDDPDVRELAL